MEMVSESCMTMFEITHNPFQAYEKNMLLGHIRYSATQHMESQTEGNGMNWTGRQAGRHGVSVAEYPVLPGFVFICKLLCDL
jgi:hypothetical protein